MNLTRSSLAVIALLLIGVAAVGAQTPAATPNLKKMKNPVATSQASVTAGAAAYKKYCAFCHGPDAAGEGKLAPKDSHPPSLVDSKWDYGNTDGEIFSVIQNGVPDSKVMKGFKGKMTDQDAWNVVNYLRSLAPKKKAS